MKASRLPLVLAVFSLSAHSESAQVTPVQKVLELLNGLLIQAKTGKHEEEVQYTGFKQFCDDATTQKQELIKAADERIDSLKSRIQKKNTEADRLAGEIVEHHSDVVGWLNDTKAAAADREVEHADYNTMHMNYTQSLQALAQAISILKEQAHDRPQSTGLVQQQAAALVDKLPLAAGSAIASFLARNSEDPDLIFNVAPEADAYEFRSHGVVAMLERLKDTFRDRMTELEREEMSRRHAHETLTQDLTDSVKAGKSSIETKTKYEGKMKQDSADASSNLQDTTTTRADDSEYLSDLVTTCQQKASDFISRQKLRSEEITAMSKAIALISGSTVTPVAEKHLPTDVAPPKASSFVQVRTSSPPSSAELKANQARAASMLLEASKRLDSRTLSAVAAQAAEDPFAKVKQLIQQLVDRLIAQAGEEAEHKGWCDAELATNEQTRTSKSKEVEGLMAQIDGTTSSIGLLAKDLAEISAQIAELNSAVAKETELRNGEKERNEQTLQEARDAQTTVAEAISVLKEFFDAAAGATAFVQGRQPAGAPPIFDAPYQGPQSQKGGVLAMLDVIHSDFARLEQDTATAEATSSDDYDKFMDASSVDKAQKEKDQEHKKSEKQTQETDLLDMQSDLESAQQALDAARASFDKLKPACLDTGVTYDERVGRRHDEVESLKEALSILNGEDVVYQHGVLVKGMGGAEQLRSDTTGQVYDA